MQQRFDRHDLRRSAGQLEDIAAEMSRQARIMRHCGREDLSRKLMAQVQHLLRAIEELKRDDPTPSE